MVAKVVNTASNKCLAINQYDIKGKELAAFLGPLEASIFEVVRNSKKGVLPWERHKVLKKKKLVAYTAIMNTLDRLYEKVLLDRRVEKGRGGWFYVFWPITRRAKLGDIFRIFFRKTLKKLATMMVVASDGHDSREKNFRITIQR